VATFEAIDASCTCTWDALNFWSQSAGGRTVLREVVGEKEN